MDISQERNILNTLILLQGDARAETASMIRALGRSTLQAERRSTILLSVAQGLEGGASVMRNRAKNRHEQKTTQVDPARAAQYVSPFRLRALTKTRDNVSEIAMKHLGMPSRPGLAIAAAAIALLSQATAAQGHLYASFYDGVTANGNMGASVSVGGDVNNDGFNDYIVGEPGGVFPQIPIVPGSAYVLSGADGSTIFSLTGDSTADYFGHSVAIVGDLNGDQHADFAIGAPWDDDNGTNSGRVRIYSGADASVLYTWDGTMGSSNPAQPGDSLGYSVACAGDFNMDGVQDVVVGAPFHPPLPSGNSTRGMVRVFSGATGAILQTFLGDSQADNLGISVDGAGLVDSDGYADVIAGAPFDDNGGPNSGMARVYSGQTGAVIHQFDGATGERLGTSVAGIGNVNGDSRDDVAVGAPTIGNGYVQVYSGLNGATLHTFAGESNGDQMGSAVSGAGDVDGDGRDDILAGAQSYDGASQFGVGKVYLFSGASGSQLFSEDAEMTRPFTLVGGANLGRAISGGSDLSGNGIPDFVAGAPGFDLSASQLQSGFYTIFSGNCGPITSYGAGCPGLGSNTPSLEIQGCPTPGGVLTFIVTGADPNEPGRLLYGLDRAMVPFGMTGCFFYLGQWQQNVQIPLNFDALGRASVSLALPTLSPFVSGLEPTFQAFVTPMMQMGGPYPNTNGVEIGIE